MVKRWTKIGFWLLPLWLLLAGCTDPGDPVSPSTEVPTEVTGVQVGDLAPLFSLPDSYGQVVDLADQRGKPVLLFFWATGCHYCQEQYPRLQGFHDDYADSLTVLGVNLGDSSPLINAYLADHHIDFPCLLATGDMQASYQVTSIPLAVLVDAEGFVVFNGHPALLSDSFLQAEF